MEDAVLNYIERFLCVDWNQLKITGSSCLVTGMWHLMLFLPNSNRLFDAVGWLTGVREAQTGQSDLFSVLVFKMCSGLGKISVVSYSHK